MTLDRNTRTLVLEAIERCFTRATINGLLYKHGVPEHLLGGSSKKELLLGVFRGLEETNQDDRLAAFIQDAVDKLPSEERAKLGMDGNSHAEAPAIATREKFTPAANAHAESDLPRHHPPTVRVVSPATSNNEESHTSYPFPVNIVMREWPKVRAAPWSFAACLVAGVVLGALVVYSLFQSFVIPGKDATIQQLSLRPESIPAHQEAQQKEIQALRAEINELIGRDAARLANAWPPLSEAQITTWAKALEAHGIKSFTVYWDQSVDAVEFYRSLRKVGEKVGFQVLPGSGSIESPMIYVGTTPKHPAGPVLLKLLAEYAPKYPLKLEPHPQGKEGSIDFFIGEKF